MELISRPGYGLKVQGDKLDVRLYMANSKSVHIFTSLEGYKVSFFRLIIVPLCTAIFMMLLPIQYYDKSSKGAKAYNELAEEMIRGNK